MTNAYVVTGTLAGGTITLDEQLPAVGGRVRVTVELVAPAPKPSLAEVMEKIWAEQQQSGHVPPTPEDVAARIREERTGWND